MYGSRLGLGARQAGHNMPTFNASLAAEWLSTKPHRRPDSAAFGTLAAICRARVEPFCSDLVQWYESTGMSKRLTKIEAFAKANEGKHADTAREETTAVPTAMLGEPVSSFHGMAMPNIAMTSAIRANAEQAVSIDERNVVFPGALMQSVMPPGAEATGAASLPSHGASGGAASGSAGGEDLPASAVSPEFTDDDFADRPCKLGSDGEPEPFGKQFGTDWARPGNTIGIAVDMFEGTVSYSLNGSWEAPWGVAHHHVKATGGLVFAATIGLGHAVRLNLGQKPFQHRPPPDKGGYRSLGSWVLERSPVLQRALAEAQQKQAEAGERPDLAEGEDAFAAAIPAGADLALAARAMQVGDDESGPASGAGAGGGGAASDPLAAPPALMRGPSTAFATDGEPQTPEEMPLRLPLHVLESNGAPSGGQTMPLVVSTETAE